MVNPTLFELREHQIEIRVRYQETDAQGRVHNAHYINYFEMGRVEMLRAAGMNYRDLEAQGLLLVVVEVGCQYLLPAAYDDLLQLTTKVVRTKGARIQHEYEITRDNSLIAQGYTVIASIDRQGNVKRLPRWLRIS